MKKNPAFCAILGGLLALGPVSAADVIKSDATSKPIQFSDLGGVRSWKAGGPDVVFVKSRSDQWYRAELGQNCRTLDTKKGINFLTETIPETASKVSKVVVDRGICEVTSLTKVDAPTPAKN